MTLLDCGSKLRGRVNITNDHVLSTIRKTPVKNCKFRHKNKHLSFSLITMKLCLISYLRKTTILTMLQFGLYTPLTCKQHNTISDYDWCLYKKFTAILSCHSTCLIHSRWCSRRNLFMLTKIYLKVISDTVILICMSFVSLGIFSKQNNFAFWGYCIKKIL